MIDAGCLVSLVSRRSSDQMEQAKSISFQNPKLLRLSLFVAVSKDGKKMFASLADNESGWNTIMLDGRIPFSEIERRPRCALGVCLLRASGTLLVKFLDVVIGMVVEDVIQRTPDFSRDANSFYLWPSGTLPFRNQLFDFFS